MTVEEAKNLTLRQVLHYRYEHSMTNQVKCENWRVNGKVKTWKRNPDRIQIPLKHGLYQYGYLTEYNVMNFHLESECS